ncbi:MAG TPA: thiamine pyrophosphate-binding protein [Capsulimonadaceae bacterium]|jgi:acetolactate synthase-1/2/3 large subunit
MKVSDYIAQYLEERGIRHVFGIVGAGNAHIFDSITKRGYTEIVCVHHEQAACMAMQTYYRTSGQITAAVLTTGGGSTNATTGIVGAWADSIPGVVISGNENSKFTTAENPLRMWGVQGYDSAGMMEKVTKYASRVMEPASISFELAKAFDVAGSGRPGPCWVDVPMNIQAANVEPDELKSYSPEADTPASLASPSLTDSVAAVVVKLRESSRPVLWLGHGIRLAGAVDKIEPLLEQTQTPALVSWAGIDMVSSDHPLVYGRAGVYGQRSANFVLQNCDFLLCVGTRLAIPQVGYDLNEFVRAATVAVVDVDPAEATKHGSRIELSIVADAGEFLAELLRQLGEAPLSPKPEWIATCDAYREKYPWIGPEHDDANGYINSYRFLDKYIAHFKPDQIVVTDMGTALLSGHQVLRIADGQRLMTSTGLGEMGFGLPAAMGASFARNKGEVLCLNCDGGMMMNLQELQTIVHHELPIKIIVFNNDGYLMIKHTQKALFKGHYSGSDQKSGVSCPNFSAVGAAFNIPTFQIRTWDDFETVIPHVQAHSGTVICEVFTDPEQPFVPKLSLAIKKDGTLVSPPLEDLSPFLPREELEGAMIVGMHAKSREIEA